MKIFFSTAALARPRSTSSKKIPSHTHTHSHSHAYIHCFRRVFLSHPPMYAEKQHSPGRNVERRPYRIGVLLTWWCVLFPTIPYTDLPRSAPGSRSPWSQSVIQSVKPLPGSAETGAALFLATKYHELFITSPP